MIDPTETALDELITEIHNLVDHGIPWEKRERLLGLCETARREIRELRDDARPRFGEEE